MKPFEATRRYLMSALCGSVCVLAYYLLIIEICMMEIFLLYHHCYCQKYTNKRKKLSSSNLSPPVFVFLSLHEAWQPLAHCQKLLTDDKHSVRVAAAPLPGYLCACTAHYRIYVGCKLIRCGFLSFSRWHFTPNSRCRAQAAVREPSSSLKGKRENPWWRKHCLVSHRSAVPAKQCKRKKDTCWLIRGCTVLSYICTKGNEENAKVSHCITVSKSWIILLSTTVSLINVANIRNFTVQGLYCVVPNTNHLCICFYLHLSAKKNHEGPMSWEKKKTQKKTCLYNWSASFRLELKQEANSPLLPPH